MKLFKSVSNTIGKHIVLLTKFLAANWAGMAMLGSVFLFVSWAIGYFAGGFWGLKFDLQSCWAGVTCIAAAGGIGAASSGINAFNHWTNSKFNSLQGAEPKTNDRESGN